MFSSMAAQFVRSVDGLQRRSHSGRLSLVSQIGTALFQKLHCRIHNRPFRCSWLFNDFFSQLVPLYAQVFGSLFAPSICSSIFGKLILDMFDGFLEEFNENYNDDFPEDLRNIRKMTFFYIRESFVPLHSPHSLHRLNRYLFSSTENNNQILQSRNSLKMRSLLTSRTTSFST